MEIKSLEKTSFNVLFKAFNEAFIDYEIQLNEAELHTMLNRRGFVPELSFGAFDDNKIVAFTFNGIGNFNGHKTAYDTGTATIKAYRGQGLATKIFAHSIPFLKEAGISQYLLEVLQHNTKAVSVYKKLGFVVSREFNYFVQKNEEIKLYSKHINPDYHLQQIDLSWSQSMIECQDFFPSWQNSFEAISHKPEDFIFAGAFNHDQKLVGYCIFEPHSGDITQIAVHKEHRRKGIASALLKKVLASNQHGSVKLINSDIKYESVTGFLQSNSIPLKGKQFEMTKQL